MQSGAAEPLNLRNLDRAALTSAVARVGVGADVAGRIFARVHRDGAARLPPGSVRGLSHAAGAALDAACEWPELEVLDRRRAEDGFLKYLFRLPDGREIEAVRIPLPDPEATRALKARRRAGQAAPLEALPTAKYTVCLSSQVGCALACDFCATGRMGFKRNLEAWEMVEQVLTVRRESPERPVTGVVFQGQGEPFQNYDNVVRAAEILRHPCGGRIRGDRITISTVGVLPMIERFTDEGLPYRLILSLTSAFSDRRERLVPLTQRYDVAALAGAMRRHAAARGGPVNLAWVLMSGVNSGADEARELARLFDGVRVRLSIIDVNDPSGRFRRADDAERGRFLSALAENGIGFVRRYSGGPDIHAACGMLASRRQGGQVVAATPAETV